MFLFLCIFQENSMALRFSSQLTELVGCIPANYTIKCTVLLPIPVHPILWVASSQITLHLILSKNKAIQNLPRPSPTDPSLFPN